MQVTLHCYCEDSSDLEDPPVCNSRDSKDT